MNNNTMLSFTVNLKELDVLLYSLTKNETDIQELKERIFNDANEQMKRFMDMNEEIVDKFNEVPLENIVKDDDLEKEDNKEIENGK